MISFVVSPIMIFVFVFFVMTVVKFIKNAKRAQREAAEELGVEYIYLYDIYNSVGTDYEGNEISGAGYTVDGTHPNIYGRELIAKTIADYLNAN